MRESGRVCKPKVGRGFAAVPQFSALSDSDLDQRPERILPPRVAAHKSYSLKSFAESSIIAN
jgi:hypothetical protein